MSRTVICLIVGVFVGGLNVEAKELAGAVLDPYLRIQTALAGDKLNGVREDAALIASGAATMGAEATLLAEASRVLERAGTIAEAREANAAGREEAEPGCETG